MLTFSVLITIVFGILQNADGASFSDCGSRTAKFTNISVSKCIETDERCTLQRNTNVSISITFVLEKDTASVETLVHGKVLGVEIPFPLSNSNACVNSGLVCPLGAGGTYTYTATLPILRKYPRVDVEVKWELQDSEQEDLICVLIPAKIK